jgi:Fe-S-cluster-containing dehydrogenase component
MFYVYPNDSGTILEAKKEGRRVEDGEFQTACSKACSTGAMKFGDMNDKSSEVRAYSIAREDIIARRNWYKTKRILSY